MKNKIIIIVIIISIVFSCRLLLTNSYGNSYDLKEIAGISVASLSEINIDTNDVPETMLNDLMQELRPFLKEVIDNKYEAGHIFSNKEAISIISSNPLKFLGAICNYVTYSLKEIFSIASEYAVVK